MRILRLTHLLIDINQCSIYNKYTQQYITHIEMYILH